jgi:hypothetical protein
MADTGWYNMVHIKGIRASHTQHLTAFIGSMGVVSLFAETCIGIHSQRTERNAREL